MAEDEVTPNVEPLPEQEEEATVDPIVARIDGLEARMEQRIAELELRLGELARGDHEHDGYARGDHSHDEAAEDEGQPDSHPKESHWWYRKIGE